MKINGSSKIISVNEEKKEKEAQENLVSVAEAVNLLPEDVVIEHDQSNIGKDKRMDKDLFEKTKPLRAKQKLFTSEAIKKARSLHPHVDKLITSMDVAIDYIAKPEDSLRSEVVQETRPPAVFGIWVLIITFGIGMTWAILAPLDSASHAIGKIILDSKKRIIQSPDGGIVKEVLVRDGDHVTKGQTLMLLDDTDIKASTQQAEYKYLSALSEVTRLIAERNDLTDNTNSELVFPSALLEKANDPEVKAMMENQTKVFSAKKDTFSSQVSHKEKNVAQYTEQKNAILPQITAQEKLIEIYTNQVDTYKKLFAKGNVSKAYLHDAQVRKADSEGRKGQLISQLAGTEQAIIQSEVELTNFKHKTFEDIVNALKQAQTELSVLSESLNEYREHLRRTVIKSPEDGNISAVNDILTPHSVVNQQQVLMEVVPQDDKLVVEAKIDATDIAAVRIGQVSRVRLTAYRARIVPVLEGKLVSLAADVSFPDQKDAQSGIQRPYYRARIEIDKDNLKELADLKDVFLYPGMGVDVMVVTGTRTLAKYIMDPITMTLDHAFREK